MAKFWNFFFFQVGWFACVLGAAHQQVFWAASGTLVYIAFQTWQSPDSRREFSLLTKVLAYGIVTDTLLMHLGYVDFQDAWPSPYLSPLWMWVLWLLVGGTLNQSLSWLLGRPILAALLGGICGPLSYEAGIQMGAGAWGSGGQFAGFIFVGVVWAIALPLFCSWNRTPIERVLVKNP